MKSEYRLVGRLVPFVSRHWFKIGLVVMAAYLVLSKDLSFNISVQAPIRQEVAPPSEQHTDRANRKETLTDNSSARHASLTNRLNLFSGVGSTPEYNLSRGIEQLDKQTVQDFILRFAHVAEAEQVKFGVPASITLANGLLQSQAGTRDGVQRGHNYFALTCTNDWVGPTLEEGRHCLRGYENAWMSFRDHSLYVTTGEYADLSRLGSSNYQAWAKALDDAGFANEDNLKEQLIEVIERYQLFQYD